MFNAYRTEFVYCQTAAAAESSFCCHYYRVSAMTTSLSKCNHTYMNTELTRY